MSGHVYRFDFKPRADLREARRLLEMAVLTAEILHGCEAVRLDGARRFDMGAGRCIIDGRGVVGRDLARLFTGFVTRLFGERSFRVLRLEGNFHDAVAESDAEEIQKMMRGRR